MHIYLVDQAGALSGPAQLPVVPGLGLQVPSNGVELDQVLPEPAAGKVWALVEGQTPVQIEDARGVYFRTDSGAQVERVELGPLPEGLTIEPRPDDLHTWDGGSWVIDAAITAAQVAATERDWRDSELATVTWLRDRHRDQLDIGAATTLTADQFSELLVYMQALRDWPQSEAFPATDQRPVPPPWIAEQTP